MMKIKPLSPKLLCAKCDPRQLRFSTTEELPELTEPVGQERAMTAIDFGIHIQQNGYNLYLLGPEGTGKYTLIHSVLTQTAKEQNTPDDWCYVNNFKQTEKPIALRLPTGMGPALQKDMSDLIEELRLEIPAIFESEEFRARTLKLEEEFKEKQENRLKQLEKEADAENLTILTTTQGFAVSPTKDGEVLTAKEFKKLPPEEQKLKEEQTEKLRKRLSEMLEEIPRWHKKKRDKQKAIQKEFTFAVVDRLIEILKNKYRPLEKVQSYLSAVEQDIIENVQNFFRTEKNLGELVFIPYQVNVLVTHAEGAGAPVIFEDHPTHSNLIGRAEYTAQMGVLTTNFTLIRPGALHQANGGYLILDAQQVLTQSFSWDSLKRMLYSQKITLESFGQVVGFPNTVALEPESIPLKIKVILLGERILYYLLCEHDPNFADLFKVAADFSNHIPRNKENFEIFSRLLATIVKKENLLPLNRFAVAKMIDHSSRMSSDSRRLFTHSRCLVDLLREANYWAKQAERGVIKAEDIQKAIEQQIYRANRIETRIQEDLERNILLIEVRGKKIGQVNALSVIQVANYHFGVPTRITATARLGKGEVIDIEREVELGGPTHSKGVLILSGFINGRYLVTRHLSIAASLVFEQNYGEIEGDSASAAELAALLSAIAKIPLKQSLAVTGSINQYGQIQAIGGVNEKIEGFFKVCQDRGLTGTQGVIIPAGNIQHLMLSDEVVQAAKEKKFFIYPIETIDQGMTLLTGRRAGKPNKSGQFPENTINGVIEKNLLEYAQRADGENKTES